MYLTSFCPPPALILRILLPPLLYAVIPACEIPRVGLQPLPLTVLLPPRLTSLGFTCLLSCSCPAVRIKISATVHTSLSLLFCIVHPLFYENSGRLIRKSLDQITGVLLEQQLRWEEAGYPSWGTFNYRLHRRKSSICRNIKIGFQGTARLMRSKEILHIRKVDRQSA